MIRAIDKVVVGVSFDGDTSELTEGTLRAIEQAQWLAAKGGEITLVHSGHGTERHETSATHEVVHVGTTTPRAARIETEVERLKALGITTEILLREEEPYRAILAAADEKQANIIVVGKHESSRRSHLGSVARALIHHSPRPVWAVQPGTRPAPECILAATDLSKVGVDVLSYANTIATPAKSELNVVHSYSVGMDVQMHPEPGDREALAKKAKDDVLAQLQEAGLPAETAVHVGQDTPASAILALDESLRPDLVVLGSVSRGGLPGFLIGNTAEALVSRLSSSLLTIKPEDFRAS